MVRGRAYTVYINAHITLNNHGHTHARICVCEHVYVCICDMVVLSLQVRRSRPPTVTIADSERISKARNLMKEVLLTLTRHYDPLNPVTIVHAKSKSVIYIYIRWPTECTKTTSY